MSGENKKRKKRIYKPAPKKLAKKKGKPRGKGFTKRPPGAAPMWKPGQSGNPNGRPRNVRFMSERLRSILENPANSFGFTKKLAHDLGVDGKESTVGDLLALQAVKYAFETKMARYFEEIMERVEGKVADRIGPENDGDFSEEMRKLLAEIDEKGGVPDADAD